MKRNGIGVVGFVVALAAFAAVPFELGQMNDWLFRISTLVMLAVSWNMMASAGMLSLGHSAFWGAGSYACLLAVSAAKLPFALSFVPALIAGGVIGLVLAVLTGRLRGVFFAIATLSLSEGFRVIGLMLPDVTGGAAGIFLAQQARPAPMVVHYTAIVGAVLAVLVAWGISVTRLRYAMRAMRDNEDAAQMLGINPLLFRTIVCVIAGAMASVAGGLNLWHSGYLSPDIAFTLHFAILAQIATIIGGIHTLPGPVIGSFAIIALSEFTRISLGTREGYSLLIYGLLLVACITWMPNGLYGLVRTRGGKARNPTATTGAPPESPVPRASTNAPPRPVEGAR